MYFEILSARVQHTLRACSISRSKSWILPAEGIICVGEEGEYSWLRGEGPRNEIHIAYVPYFIITTLETYLQ
jgi:hypothetical protein